MQNISEWGSTQRAVTEKKRGEGQDRKVFVCSIYYTIALISHASKVIHKILQSRLQKYKKQELPDVQAEFRKGRGIRDQIASIHWSIEKVGEFQKNIYFCFLDYAKAFACMDHNKLWKILKELGMPTIPASWESCMQAKKQQL